MLQRWTCLFDWSFDSGWYVFAWMGRCDIWTDFTLFSGGYIQPNDKCAQRYTIDTKRTVLKDIDYFFYIIDIHTNSICCKLY